MTKMRWIAGAGPALLLGWMAQHAAAATIGQPSGTGAWQAVAESRTELPAHTLYRPLRWPATPVPLFVWGNGGCSANGLAHAAYLRENARADGEFRNRIDLTRVAVGGHSCGGLQALAVSHDPRIDTTLVLNSGIYIRPGGRSGVAIDKTQLTRLHAPVLYLTGGPGDVAHENALDDFAKQERVPVFLGVLPVGHGGTFSAPDGGDWARVSLR
jgi:hypothetical protein